MNDQIEFTLIVKPHSFPSKIYFVVPTNEAVQYLTATSEDYPENTKMDFFLYDKVNYNEKLLCEEKYKSILKAWSKAETYTLKETLEIETSVGFGGTDFSLCVEIDGMELTFSWYQFSRERNPTPFDELIEEIIKG